MKQRISILSIIILLFISTINAQSPAEKGLNVINQATLKSQLTFLSSDWFNGREATTPGAYMAADYLASIFHGYGLMPAGEDSSFFQSVPLMIYKPTKKAKLTIKDGNRSVSFQSQIDFFPPMASKSLETEAQIIWGGYGFSHPSLKELTPKMANGKIMIRIKGLPEVETSNSYLTTLSNKKESEISVIKHETAQQLGVTAILEFDPTNPYLKEGIALNPIEKNKATAENELNKRSSGIYKNAIQLPYVNNNNIPVFKISHKVISSIIPNFDETLKNYTANIKNGKVTNIQLPASKALLSYKAKKEFKSCRNVIAMIKGNEKPEEIIVVGAHYDHLGAYDGYIWNGADDNGSGAIGVTAIAKAFMATGTQPKRTVIFATWTAEERGLHGSRYFVDHCENINQVKYYHNYDMIGRSFNPEKPDSAVSLLYTESWKHAEKLSDKFNKDYKLGLKINFSPWDNPVGGSDNAYFAKKGIPIMWYHTGGHPDYHMPSDHVDKIDWQKFEGIVKNSFLTLWELANE